MPYLDSEIVTLRNGTAFAVYAGDGAPIVATRVGDPALPQGLAAYGIGYGRAGEATVLHRGMPAETIREFCRAHGGVQSAGAAALEILRRMTPAPPPAPLPVFAPMDRAPRPTGPGSRKARAAAQLAAYHAAVPSAAPVWRVPNVTRPAEPMPPDLAATPSQE